MRLLARSLTGSLTIVIDLLRRHVDGLPYETEHRMHRSDGVYRWPIVFVSAHRDRSCGRMHSAQVPIAFRNMPFDNNNSSTLYKERSKAS
jgi:hypothetical protein